jgi:small subunit ribosomal protein S4e
LGRKGVPKGLKRKPAPRFWPIHRKELFWVVKPSPGPHSLENCLPLAVVLRDVLGLAKTRKEAKTIVSKGKVHVDHEVRREDNFPVGLMDVVSMPDMERNFRVIPSSKGLTLYPIKKKESNFKLCRIENKTVVKEGNVQLNLHDGTNIQLEVADSENPPEDTYKPLDTAKINLPEREIVSKIEMKEENFAIIIGGKNIGKHGKIIEIQGTEGRKLRKALVTIEDKTGDRYQTILNLVFAIGEAKPLISLPEATTVV